MLEVSGISSVQIIGYGFGVPVELDENRNTVIKLPNILDENGNCIVNYPLRDKIEEVFGKDKIISINNDVEAILISEIALNDDVSNDLDVLMLACGTGFGGALKKSNEFCKNVLTGHDLFIDPYTKKLIEENARVCNCSGYAHIELYCNIEAVKKDYERFLGSEIPKDVRSQSDIVTRIFNVAILNDKDIYVDREIAINAVSLFLDHLNKTIILEMIKEFFIENDYDIDVESISIVQAKIKNSVVQLIML